MASVLCAVTQTCHGHLAADNGVYYTSVVAEGDLNKNGSVTCVQDIDMSDAGFVFHKEIETSENDWLYSYGMYMLGLYACALHYACMYLHACTCSHALTRARARTGALSHLLTHARTHTHAHARMRAHAGCNG